MPIEDHLTPFGCKVIQWLIGKEANNENIAMKNTNAKHPILFRIEEENHPQLYGSFKKISKHYDISIPIEQEMTIFLHNQIMPRLYELSKLNGTDLIESSKDQIVTLGKELDKLIENKQTVIHLERCKKTSYDNQNELLTFSTQTENTTT